MTNRRPRPAGRRDLVAMAAVQCSGGLAVPDALSNKTIERCPSLVEHFYRWFVAAAEPCCVEAPHEVDVFARANRLVESGD